MISYSKNMMLRNKYILFIFLFLIWAQGVASQVVVLDSVDVIDSIDTIESIEFLDTVELADAEFEAWLEKYAIVNAQLDDTTNISSETMALMDSTENLYNDSVSMSLDVVKDSVERKDFVELVREGEECVDIWCVGNIEKEDTRCKTR